MRQSHSTHGGSGGAGRCVCVGGGGGGGGDLPLCLCWFTWAAHIHIYRAYKAHEDTTTLSQIGNGLFLTELNGKPIQISLAS